MKRSAVAFAGIVFGVVAAAAGVPAQKASTPAAVEAEKAQLLDLNVATLDQLKRLPGIGDAYARRIIAGRPYSAKNQIMTRGVIPAAAYERIKDGIVTHRATRP